MHVIIWDLISIDQIYLYLKIDWYYGVIEHLESCDGDGIDNCSCEHNGKLKSSKC